MSPNLDLKQGISYMEREGGGGGRDRDIESYRGTEKQRDRADNKNPELLVSYNKFTNLQILLRQILLGDIENFCDQFRIAKTETWIGQHS